MMNRKKNLIEALHGSFMFIDNLPELIDKETIYNETGHVDTEFLTAILQWMARMADISVKVQQTLNRLLGVEETSIDVKKKSDSGAKWNVTEILKHCTLKDNILKLPNVRLNQKSYAEAKKWIEEAGGEWKGGKIQGFTFPFNPQRVFSILQKGERVRLQQEFQFFETPSKLADWLVSFVGEIVNTDKVLEPSAGRGAIVKAIHRNNPNVTVDCYEMMPENKEILSSFDCVNILGDDFTTCADAHYDKIIANPPFANNQDIAHVKKMYCMLNKGGILASIISAHWEFAQEKVCSDFRDWLKDVNAHIYDIDGGEFKDSGTMIKSKAIVIIK